MCVITANFSHVQHPAAARWGQRRMTRGSTAPLLTVWQACRQQTAWQKFPFAAAWFSGVAKAQTNLVKSVCDRKGCHFERNHISTCQKGNLHSDPTNPLTALPVFASFFKNSSLSSDIVEFLLAGLLTDTADVSPVCLTATSVLVQRAGEASYWNVREEKPNVPGWLHAWWCWGGGVLVGEEGGVCFAVLCRPLKWIYGMEEKMKRDTATWCLPVWLKTSGTLTNPGSSQPDTSLKVNACCQPIIDTPPHTHKVVGLIPEGQGCLLVLPHVIEVFFCHRIFMLNCFLLVCLQSRSMVQMGIYFEKNHHSLFAALVSYFLFCWISCVHIGLDSMVYFCAFKL